MAGFNTAITGIKAATTSLDVIGNNIANASTVGYKSSSVQFGDIYTTAVVGAGSSNVTGSGVTVMDIQQDFSGGTIEFTNNNLDLAIDGSGYFVLDDGQGGVTYTRAGNFGLDSDGNIVSSNGKNVQGYGVDSSGNLLPVDDLKVSETESPPKATEAIGLAVNIDSREDASKLVTPYDKDNADTFTHSATVPTFDSLGNAQTIKVNYVEQPPHREVQTLDLTTNTGGFAAGDSAEISGVTVDLNDLFNGTVAERDAQIDALMAGDPRIASVSVDGTTEDIQITFKASATDVDNVQVGSVSIAAAGGQFSGISSTNLAANEVHTYDLNNGAFDATGVLVDDTTLSIGGVDVQLTAGMTEQQVAETVTAQQAQILDQNPNVESVELVNNGSDYQIKITYDALAGNVKDDALSVSAGTSNGVPVMNNQQIVTGDNSFDGVYSVYAYLDGEELLDIGKQVDPGEVGDASGATEPGKIIMTFAPTSGLLSSVNGDNVVPGGTAPELTIKGADPANELTEISLNLSGTTQFASASSLRSSSQDGYTKGDLVGVSFSETGEMVASFSNNQSQTLGVVAIATFSNQDGLNPSGDTEWSASFASGQALLNPPGTGLNGSLQSGALEQSNVDQSTELVRLIEAQRNYQASSKVLETLNTVTQSILQI